jgi:hypothetical protein
MPTNFSTFVFSHSFPQFKSQFTTKYTTIYTASNFTIYSTFSFSNFRTDSSNYIASISAAIKPANFITFRSALFDSYRIPNIPAFIIPIRMSFNTAA